MQTEEEPIEVKHKKFSNGDVYLGGWRAGLVRNAGAPAPDTPAAAATPGWLPSHHR
jgi:hypothetical protein